MACAVVGTILGAEDSIFAEPEYTCGAEVRNGLGGKVGDVDKTAVDPCVGTPIGDEVKDGLASGDAGDVGSTGAGSKAG